MHTSYQRISISYDEPEWDAKKLVENWFPIENVHWKLAEGRATAYYANFINIPCLMVDVPNGVGFDVLLDPWDRPLRNGNIGIRMDILVNMMVGINLGMIEFMISDIRPSWINQ